MVNTNNCYNSILISISPQKNMSAFSLCVSILLYTLSICVYFHLLLADLVNNFGFTQDCLMSAKPFFVINQTK